MFYLSNRNSVDPIQITVLGADFPSYQQKQAVEENWCRVDCGKE
jgi:hypothetical protein